MKKAEEYLSEIEQLRQNLFIETTYTEEGSYQDVLKDGCEPGKMGAGCYGCYGSACDYYEREWVEGETITKMEIRRDLKGKEIKNRLEEIFHSTPDEVVKEEAKKVVRLYDKGY